MMSDRDPPPVRGLLVPGQGPMPRTSIVPMPTNKQTMEVRSTLAQFLDATLMRPLGFDDQQREKQINDALDTMTLTERVFIECEMQARKAPMHSFDYDPLR